MKKIVVLLLSIKKIIRIFAVLNKKQSLFDNGTKSKN